MTVRTGRDGEQYPSAALTRKELNHARRLAHRLVCRDGMSVRAAQARMAELGVRRSTGIIQRDLTDFQCPDCPCDQVDG